MLETVLDRLAIVAREVVEEPGGTAANGTPQQAF